MFGVDERAIEALQWVYNQLLDQLGARIGTFRMTIALTPVAADITGRIFSGDALFDMLPDMLSLVGVSIFYSLRMMKFDDQLQMRHRFRVINTRSLRFRSKHVVLRLLYLFFFTSSFVFHHNVSGLGMLAIVYARCLTVRERRTIEKHYWLASLTPSAG